MNDPLRENQRRELPGWWKVAHEAVCVVVWVSLIASVAWLSDETMPMWGLAVAVCVGMSVHEHLWRKFHGR